MALISNVKVTRTEGISDEIVQKCIDMMEKENPGRTVVEIEVRATGNPDEYGITPVFKPIKFDRIRRVTGYLAGDVRSFNDAKRAEERDRVKHEVF